MRLVPNFVGEVCPVTPADIWVKSLKLSSKGTLIQKDKGMPPSGELDPLRIPPKVLYPNEQGNPPHRD